MWCGGMGQGLFYASAAVVRKPAVFAACVYNVVQQISGLVIILKVYYLAAVRILVLDEDSVLLFAVQVQGKILAVPKPLQSNTGRWMRINRLKGRSSDDPHLGQRS